MWGTLYSVYSSPMVTCALASSSVSRAAASAVVSSFSMKPGGRCPRAGGGFEGAAQQQVLPLPLRDGADDQFGILVMHFAAGNAHMTHAVVVRRGTKFDRCAA